MAVKTIPMSYEQFAAIPDNPRQRDTVRHAQRAIKNHLREASPTHSLVAVATINGTPVFKLDGHTRSYLWGKGLLEKPNGKLAVSLFEISSEEEGKELYTHFDNASATECPSDKLAGACRESGIELHGSLLSKHTFNTAIKLAHALNHNGGGQTEYEIVPLWAKVLTEVDSWELPKVKFKGTGIVALMFIAVAAETIPVDVVADFFQRFAKDAGEKTGRLRDGVQALTEHMADRRLHNMMTGADNIFDMMHKSLSCLTAWSKNQKITNVQPSREALVSLHATARRNVDSGKFAN
jgi:hypothetical protein